MLTAFKKKSQLTKTGLIGFPAVNWPLNCTDFFFSVSCIQELCVTYRAIIPSFPFLVRSLVIHCKIVICLKCKLLLGVFRRGFVIYQIQQN